MKDFKNLIEEFNKSMDSVKKIKSFSFNLEYDILESEYMPQTYFEFYIEILKNSNYININGAENIIFALFNDFEKLDDNRKKDILETILRNSNYYNNEKTIYYISDLLVRKYEKNKLKKILRVLENKVMRKFIEEILEIT